MDFLSCLQRELRAQDEALSAALEEEEHADVAGHVRLEDLRGCVLRMAECRGCHGKTVVVAALDAHPPEQTRFFTEELRGHCAMLATRHRGSFVLQKVLEKHAPCHELAEEILEQALLLAEHRVGNRTVQCLLALDDPQHRERILRMLEENLQRVATSRFGCYVLQHALTGDHSARLARLVRASSTELRRTEHGSFVLKTLRK